MGGRIAEELVFNEMSSGAANDIERATETARAMVCRWGMSTKLGPLSFGAREGEVFLGRDLYSRPDYSEETARQIDLEVREIVISCYDRAKKVLQENFDTLNRIANALIEYETLEADDVEVLVKGGTITRERPKPRVHAPPKLEKKDKRKILDALEPLPALEPNKA
jgi:cell division protease FtsH